MLSDKLPSMISCYWCNRLLHLQHLQFCVVMCLMWVHSCTQPFFSYNKILLLPYLCNNIHYSTKNTALLQTYHSSSMSRSSQRPSCWMYSHDTCRPWKLRIMSLTDEKVAIEFFILRRGQPIAGSCSGKAAWNELHEEILWEFFQNAVLSTR